MHDLVIRGGTILDGTGAAAFAGDVAIDGAKIAQVGGKAGPAKREIDANGLLVTPGWVDVQRSSCRAATPRALIPSRSLRVRRFPARTVEDLSLRRQTRIRTLVPVKSGGKVEIVCFQMNAARTGS